MNKEKNSIYTLLIKTVLIIVFASGLYLIHSFFFNQELTPISSLNIVNESLEDDVQNSAIKLTRSLKKSKKNAPDTSNYQYCENLVKTHENSAYDWAIEQHEGWERYLSTSYTLDDITLAIEHFTNSNFAASFRVQQLRSKTNLAIENNLLNKQLKQSSHDLYQAGFHYQSIFPSEEIAQYAYLSDSEKKQLLHNFRPTIDDVAYFIGQPEISDTEIITLLGSLKDVAAIVNYDRLETTSILDYAVESSRSSVVKKLLELGVAPSNDNYLGSTMEWALSRLSYSLNDTAQKQKANIVLMLMNYDAKARFEAKSITSILGYFPRQYYDFSAETIAVLMRDYGLDLTLIESREVPLVNKNSHLIALLEEKQATELSTKLAINNISEQVSTCKKTISVVLSQWRPESTETILKRVIAQHPNSPEVIALQLAEIDPRLFDYYYPSYNNTFREVEYVTDVNQYFAPLKEGDIQTVIDNFSAMTLTDANKNWLFTEILMRDMSFYGELLNSSLMVDELQYFDFPRKIFTAQSLNKLQAAGANLHDKDSRGKTLLFYAVKKANIELLNYMLENKYPFSLSQNGEDPLHVILNTLHYQFSLNKVAAMVDVLMQYQPEIDQFHLNRMAVLKLKYPRLYQQLSEKHPQLAVSDDRDLPDTT